MESRDGALFGNKEKDGDDKMSQEKHTSRIYKAMNLFGNVVINKIPSRHLRKAFYQLLGAKIGRGTYLFRRVETLQPCGLVMGDHCSVGWFTLLDARGGYKLQIM